MSIIKRVACCAFVKDITFRRTAIVFAAIGVVAVATFAMLRNEGRGVALEGVVEPDGPVKTVIVRMQNADYISTKAQINSVKAEIEGAGSELQPVIDALPGYHKLVHRFENFPLVIYEVDAEGEASLKSSPLVKSVAESRLMEPLPATNILSPIEAAMDGSDENGFTDGTSYYDGSGQKIVVIDSGVNKNHVALAGRIVEEACYSFVRPVADGTLLNICEGGTEIPFGADMFLSVVDGANSALPCDETYASCDHGTMVAASAVMAPISLAPNFVGLPAGTILNTRGVASGAGVVAIKAGVIYDSATGARYAPDDLSTLYALDYVYELAVADSTIAAINLSSGSAEDFASTIAECENVGSAYDYYNDLFGQFKSIGVATFVAAGNSGDGENMDKISTYSCAENAIAVSASKNDGSGMAFYANNGPLTDLLAPGGDESQAVAEGAFTVDTIDDVLWMPKAFNNNTFDYTQGTSFAAPMAAGAFAVLREKHPNVSVDALVGLLKSTGKPVVDVRAGYTVGAKPLIQLNAALAVSLDNSGPGNGGGSGDGGNGANPNQPGGPGLNVPNTGGATRPSVVAMSVENLGLAVSDKRDDALVMAIIVGIISTVSMVLIAARHFGLIGSKIRR